ncbi:MAG: nucleotidyltransferase domain-containing protein [Sulfurimonas sp.]|nr:nucleotidyltransferase domain-containing protein [Sulfurimonas sp.]PHQ90972.1 MAG: DNA polymerase III subunit beta [Sulfurimonas sp.]
MRLRQSEIDLLKSTLTSLSKEAKLYLFGSRVDDTKKGGDIDLLVVSKKLKKKDLRILRIEFFKIFGEQKIDVLLDDGKFSNIFHQLIFKKAVLL